VTAQPDLFADKPYVGPKMSAAAQRAWREKNRDHVRAESRQRAKRRNHSEYMKAWRKKNRPKLRAKERRARLKRYGLTPDDYNRMVIAQNNCCAVCGRPSASLTLKNDRHQHFALDVDHCHATGKVRGRVCCNCNAILGHAKDDVGRLLKAIDYLRAHGVQS
jgi:hypothetical protein